MAAAVDVPTVLRANLASLIAQSQDRLGDADKGSWTSSRFDDPHRSHPAVRAAANGHFQGVRTLPAALRVAIAPGAYSLPRVNEARTDPERNEQ